MRAVLDACVLYPTVVRELLTGAARAGLFTPLWGQRILDEWGHVATRNSPEEGVIAAGEIALLQVAFPGALVEPDPGFAETLYLPDSGDLHVLAAAIAGGAEAIITFNLSDFPPRALRDHGLVAIHPDAFLRDFLGQQPEAMGRVIAAVRAKAEALSGQDWPVRKLLKKARLPRLGKAAELAGL